MITRYDSNMNLNLNDLEYLARIMNAIKNRESIKIKPCIESCDCDANKMFCPECDSIIDARNDLDHLIYRDYSSTHDDSFIAICCEGYHRIDI